MGATRRANFYSDWIRNEQRIITYQMLFEGGHGSARAVTRALKLAEQFGWF